MSDRNLSFEHFAILRKQVNNDGRLHSGNPIINVTLPWQFSNDQASRVKGAMFREIAKVFVEERKKLECPIPLYATILDRIEADYALSLYKHDERMKFHIEENWEQKLKLNACDELRLKILLRDEEGRKKVFFVPAQNNNNNQKKKG